VINIGHEMEHEESERDEITGRKRKVNVLSKKKLSKDDIDNYMLGDL
jgi:hypothetical protein